jgi:O-glycosyl hydrolase
MHIVAAVAILASLAQAQITINVASTLQRIDGFGVSQAFGRAVQFQALAATPQKEGLDYLFSTTTGAGLSIIRNRIGSTNTTGDSILPTSPGSPTGTPTYVWDKNDTGQVWFSQQAMSYGVKIIYADAWSAPGFMKTNGDESNGGYLCGVTGEPCSSGDWRQAFANMIAQYVKYYAEVGIPITHVGFLNEPELVCVSSTMRSLLLS